MSSEVSFQKQVLSIMDTLVTSIVTEICQLDIFLSKRQSGNPETDIKLINMTAAIRKITNSTAEHICRIIHKASTGQRKHKVNNIKQSFRTERPLNIKEEEPVEGGDQLESLTYTTSDRDLLQAVEEEPEFTFEEAFGHEECLTDVVDEPSAGEPKPVGHRRGDLITEPNSVPLNTDSLDVIETALDATADATEEGQADELTCETCGKTFTHLNNLRGHQQKLHIGEAPHACHECRERFSSRRLLQIHRRVHRVQKPHKCRLCEKAFRLPNHLTNHMLSHGERPFTCSTCGKSFTKMSILKAHEGTHSSEKNFVCSQCGSRFLTKSYLDYHQRVHTGEKPYVCNHCGRSFAQKGNLKAHERLHTGEQPFRCEDCGQSFVHANTFKSHKQLHSGVTAFCCELCGKGFRRGSHLKTHLLTHSGEKPFSCDVCEKTFALKGSLKTHKLTHTGQKSYTCSVCSKSFTQASSLAKHKRLHSREKTHHMTL